MPPQMSRSSVLKAYKKDLAQYKADLIKYQSELAKHQENLEEWRNELQRCRDEIGDHRTEMQRYCHELDSAQRHGTITMVNHPERQAQINGWLAWSDIVTAKLEVMYG